MLLVNHDDQDGTALDPLVWSAGGRDQDDVGNVLVQIRTGVG